MAIHQKRGGNHAKKNQVVSDNVRERFASNIRRSRGWMQMTQTQLAEKTDMTQDQIAKFERMNQSPYSV